MLQKILSYLDLRKELELSTKIHEEIESGIVFKGINIWILVFAIVIASVGLNINSTAVIIGAMLISPLMGPINGIGYSLATYDFVLLRRSIKNFAFAVVASLVASMLYFVLTPVSSAHSELLARTTPTIYDVIIALFGGLAGIVALASKRKGNVIPGVAIATALMPPLCTAGYGLGTGQMSFFFGAIYLFAINTVFIALASLAVSRFFKFPITTVIDDAKKKSITRWISIVTIITVLPSLYFGYKLVLNERFNEHANQYVNSITIYEGNYLLKSEIDAAERTIKLVYAGAEMSEASKELITENAENFKLGKPTISIKQGFSLSEGGNELDEEAQKQTEHLNNNLNAAIFEVKEKNKKIDSLLATPLLGQEILREVKAMYPKISSCTYSETFLYSDSSTVNNDYKVITFSAPRRYVSSSDSEKIMNWLKAKLAFDRILLFVQEEERK